VIATVAAATAEDVNSAVQAARSAFDSGIWSGLTGQQRAVYLRKIAAGIHARLDQLLDRFVGVAGRADGGDYFCSSHNRRFKLP
jgi:acyl-CoA reductase-like NAD-dependent aldehyde dehydrogenase